MTILNDSFNHKIFNHKNIILGICGGIAAYKSAVLLRLLIKQGAQVQVVMTQASTEFISPLTFQALSGNLVRTTLFDPDADASMGHIELARWADVIIIAPATANTIAKIAHGLADNLLTTLCLASQASLIIAPAMNKKMWCNESVQHNIQLLSARETVFISGPEEGEQACGDIGEGRMSEPAELLDDCMKQLKAVQNSPAFNQSNQILSGQKVLITAGPTIEDIDPVRYISNRSSGKMGYAIAQVAQEQGAEVILISGVVALEVPQGVEVVQVRSAQQMHDAVFQRIADIDIFIATAAVADYRPRETISSKIKKTTDTLTLELVKNPDILADVGALEHRPIIIGFAAETNDIKKHALDKLYRKKLDMIVANEVGDNKGFEVDNNELHIFWRSSSNDVDNKQKNRQKNSYKNLAYASKAQLAKQLINEITRTLVNDK